MIDALAILIDQARIDPTKYIEMECGIQHRCKDELFSSLMRSLNASQTSARCNFAMVCYLHSGTVEVSEERSGCRGWSHAWEPPVGLCTGCVMEDVKREGHAFTPPPPHPSHSLPLPSKRAQSLLCFSFQGCIVMCVCRHWHFHIS